MEIPNWVPAALLPVLPIVLIIALALLQYWVQRMTYTRGERAKGKKKMQFPEETHLHTVDPRTERLIVLIICIVILAVLIYLLYPNGSLQ